MQIKHFEGGYDSNLSYVVHDEKILKGIVIDPLNSEEIVSYVKENKIDLVYIINTHSHFDHVEGNDLLKNEFSCPVVSHELEEDKADMKVKDGQVLEVGNLKIKVIHTPGHTPGGICLLIDNYLFTGDTIFINHVGRTDFPGGSQAEMIASIKKLMQLNDDIIIYPGHNYDYLKRIDSTIGQERKNNPFVREHNG